MPVQPTTRPSCSATHRCPGQPLARKGLDAGDLGLEGGVAGGDAFGVDVAHDREIRVGHRAGGHVGREVGRAAGPVRLLGGQGAHDDVGGVREAGAAGRVDRDHARGADLVDDHEPVLAEPVDVVGAGGLLDAESGGQVSDPHRAGRRGRHRVQEPDPGRVGQRREPLRVQLERVVLVEERQGGAVRGDWALDVCGHARKTTSE